MTEEIQNLEAKLEELKAELCAARHNAPRQEVHDFGFTTLNGPITLSEMFGQSSELILIHNMGQSCSYCTLWADGLNGFTKPFEDRCAFFVVSPDSPEVQRDFGAKRDWKFKMASDASKEFSKAMGYWSESDGAGAGVSTFIKEDGKIYRTGTAEFGPGDEFCSVWPIMDLLGGPKGWEPKFDYRESLNVN